MKRLMLFTICVVSLYAQNQSSFSTSGGGGGGSTGGIVSFHGVSQGQGAVSGVNFDNIPIAGVITAEATCNLPDALNGLSDAACYFAYGTTYQLPFHFYASSTFVDGVKVQIVDWNSPDTGSHAATFQVAFQSVAVGGTWSSSGYGSLVSLGASTTGGSGVRNETGVTTVTTGCVADSVCYGYIQLTSANNGLSSGSNPGAYLKRLVLTGTGITQ